MNSRALALALAITVTILWALCGLFVWLTPGMMIGMSGHMIHTDLSDLQWHMPLSGFLLGGIFWIALAAITGYLIGAVYNRLDSQTDA